MGTDKKPVVNGIVVEEHKRPRRFGMRLPQSKKSKIIVTVIVLLIGAGLVAGSLWYNQKAAEQAKSEAPSLRVPRQADVEKIHQLYIAGDVEGARAYGKEALARSSELSQADLTQLTSAYMGVEVNEENYSAAVEIYNAASAETKDTFQLQYGYAIAQRQLGNTSEALAAFKRAKELIPAGETSTSRQEARAIDQVITELESAQ